MFSALSLSDNFRAFQELFQVFRIRGRLIYELTRREISDRYTGQVFGLFWTIGHPLIQTLVYIFVFGTIFRARVGGTTLDYTSYILSGLIPWMVFAEVLGKSSTIIVFNANVVKQVIFPIEVLPIKSVLASLVTGIVFFCLMAIYMLFTAHAVPWTYISFPVLILLQTMAMIGVSYLFSSIGAYLRDLKDFVQMFLSMAFYFMPILYLPESIPAFIRPILYVNPLSYMIWSYQDALYYGSFMHPWAWVIFGLESLFVFVLGYRVFRRLKVMFGNVL